MTEETSPLPKIEPREVFYEEFGSSSPAYFPYTPDLEIGEYHVDVFGRKHFKKFTVKSNAAETTY